MCSDLESTFLGRVLVGELKSDLLGVKNACCLLPGLLILSGKESVEP